MISLTKDEEGEEVKSDEDGWTEVKKRDGCEGAVPTEHLLLGMMHDWQTRALKPCSDKLSHSLSNTF